LIVISADPGTRHLGWGLMQRTGTRVAHLAHGVIDTDTTRPIAERLCQIERELEEVVKRYRPTASAVESLFFAKDPSAAAKLGHARGVVLLVLARAGLAIAEYPPARVKRAIVGSGRADKHQIAMVMCRVLGLGSPPRADAADALAVAMTHANASIFERNLARLAPRSIKSRPRPRSPLPGAPLGPSFPDASFPARQSSTPPGRPAGAAARPSLPGAPLPRLWPGQIGRPGK
jgi:crossover junction endodeoxyribonuclease RuvC